MWGAPKCVAAVVLVGPAGREVVRAVGRPTLQIAVSPEDIAAATRIRTVDAEGRPIFDIDARALDLKPMGRVEDYPVWLRGDCRTGG